MKIIDRIVTQDGNDHWRLREIMSKLRGQRSEERRVGKECR